MDFYSFYKKYGLFCILAALLALFSILNHQFMSLGNMMNILRQVSMFGIVIVGYTLIMIGGGSDMSVGGQMALCGMFSAMLDVNLGLPVIVAVPLTLLLGAVFGSINGLLTNTLKVHSVIITLATMLFYQGASFILSSGRAVYGVSKPFKYIGQGSIGPIPVPVILFILIAVIGYIALHKTYFGRHVFAMGGNPEAARLAGINTKKYRLLCFVITGVLVAISGIIMTARTGNAQPGAGSSYPFDCMTAAVLGGVSFAGGSGSMLGAMMGVVIIGVLNNGMQLVGMDSNMISCIKGILLLVAIGIDSIQSAKRMGIR